MSERAMTDEAMPSAFKSGEVAATRTWICDTRVTPFSDGLNACLSHRCEPQAYAA